MTDQIWDWQAARSICLSEARRVLGAGHEAEDAAQDALVRAWRARDTCASPGRPEGWMTVIARNTARTHGSAASARAAREPLVLADRDAADQRAGDQLAAVAERATVQRVLERLSAADRKLLALRYEDDLTQEEIARRLEWPEGTVKVRLHRLRRRLREELTST